MNVDPVAAQCDALNELIKMISVREDELKSMKEVRDILMEIPEVKKRREEFVKKVIDEALEKDPQALGKAICAPRPKIPSYGMEDKRCHLYDDCRDKKDWPGPGWVTTRRGGYRQLGVYDG
jgi:hypothetical protein